MARIAGARSTVLVRITAPTSPSASWRPTACADHSTAGSSTPRHCLETPAGRRLDLVHRIRQRSYPLQVRSASSSPGSAPGSVPPDLPAFDAVRRAGEPRLRLQGPLALQLAAGARGGMDPAHPSFLHRYLEDESSLEAAYGRSSRRQRRQDGGRALADDAGDTRVLPARDPLRERGRRVAAADDAAADDRRARARAGHPRRLPGDLRDPAVGDDHGRADARAGRRQPRLLVQLLPSFDAPLDKETMRAQRLACVSLSGYAPLKGRHNHWGFDPEEQRTRTYLGMGEEDINLHDQWAVEASARIQDRTPGAPRHHRQGRHGQPAHLAEGDRGGARRRPAADDAGERGARPPPSPDRTRSTASPPRPAGTNAGAAPPRPSVPARPGWPAVRCSRARRLEPRRR